MRLLAVVPLVLALAACSTTTVPVGDDVVVKPDDGLSDLPDGGDPVDDPTTGGAVLEGARSPSGHIAVSEDELYLFIADPDNGDLVRSEIATGLETRLALGGEPTRVTRVGDAIFVTLRASGEVVRVDVDAVGAMTVAQRRAVGAEPFDVLASRDRSMIFVSLSQEDAIVALDGTDLHELGRWQAPGEPRWMTLGTGKDTVYVAMARRPIVLALHPSTGEQEWHALPSVRRFVGATCDPRHLKVRNTGDMTMAPDGDLLVPALFVDTELIDNRTTDPLAGSDTADSGFVPVSTDTGTTGPCPELDPPRVPSAYYGPPADPITPGEPNRFTPVMVRFRFGSRDGSPEAITLGTLMRPSPFSPTGTRGSDSVVRSYPSSIVVGTSNHADHVAFVSVPSAGAILAVNLDDRTSEDAGTLIPYARVAANAPFGVSSLTTLPGNDGRILGWSLVERASYAISVNDITAGLFDASLVGWAFDVEHPTAPSALPEAVQRGRRLFYASDLPTMAAPSSGVSCESCHADGRSDGMVWLFEDFPRNTPTLAGTVSDTMPVTWTGEVATVIDEIHATNVTRMNGTGVSDEQAADIAAFVDFTRQPVRPQPQSDEDRASVARGDALFHRADVGCATCHAGAAMADGEEWRVAGFGRRTNTPTLRGIGASGPYFHDGSASTLRDVLLRARDGSMGNTGLLSQDELVDLEAYLRTL
ncbi:MAG: c-type cytochrome [Alphaproteobacteria bacterium]|nr:c-type cytochrome [Alphaproteobacteria bacterium]